MHELSLGFLLAVAAPSILFVLGLVVLATANGHRFQDAWFRRVALTLIFFGSMMSGFGAAAFVESVLWVPIIGLACATSFRSIRALRTPIESKSANPLPSLKCWLCWVWLITIVPGVLIQAAL